MTLPSQRYPSLVQLNQADVIKLLKYLAFLSRFGHNFITTNIIIIVIMMLMIIIIIIVMIMIMMLMVIMRMIMIMIIIIIIIIFLGHGTKRQAFHFFLTSVVPGQLWSLMLWG